MATRRIPLIPPPLSVTPEQGDAKRGSVEEHAARGNRSSAGSRGTAGNNHSDDERASAPHATERARAYRGKASGEFERVSADTDALVAEAHGWISKLTDDDNYRRLLKLAVLRRDCALLSGLLDALRRR